MKKLNNGFTLIEVMVSLAVVATGITAAVLAMSNFSLNTSRLENKMIAQWLVANRLVEYELKAHDSSLRNSSSTNLIQTIHGREWYLQESSTVQPGGIGQIVKIRVCSDQAYEQCFNEVELYISYKDFDFR